jgi:hypothetical protein
MPRMRAQRAGGAGEDKPRYSAFWSALLQVLESCSFNVVVPLLVIRR